MNYSTFYKALKSLAFLIICFGATLPTNAQIAEFRFGEPTIVPGNKLLYPIQVKSNVGGTLDCHFRIISSTTDFDFENSRLTNLTGTILPNPHNGNSNNNNGPDFGFPCEYFYKSGTASVVINDSGTLNTGLNSWVDIAVFEAGILGNLPVQFCPTLIFEKNSLGSGYTVGSDGLNATVQNGNTYQIMDIVTNNLNWLETNPTAKPYGAPIEECHETECETPNPNCIGVDAQFRIGEPLFDIFENQLEYPIQINSSLAGFVESNVRLFTSTGFYNANNMQLSDVSSNILDGHELDVSTGNGGEGFGLPCELIRISGNVAVEILQADTWQDIAILEAGVNGNIPVSFCPSIIFDQTSECDGYIPPSAGLQAIINNNNISQPINEIVNHLNWVETDPINAQFGYQYEVCGEDACADECEDLITMQENVGNKRSRLRISYNGTSIPNNRQLTECCITWQAPGIPEIPCPTTGPFPPYNFNPIRMSNGTGYTATVTCGDCTVVFSGVAGQGFSTDEGNRIGIVGTGNEIEILPSIVQTNFQVKNLVDAKSLHIINANGAEVFNSEIPQGANSFDMNIENFEKGIYILVVKNANGSIQTEKLIKH